MNVEIFPYRLQYHSPFRIAHTERSHTVNAYLLLSHRGFHGWGEAAFPPYMSETLDSFINFFKQLRLPEDPFEIEFDDYISNLLAAFPDRRAAVAALDIAWHNLQKAASGKSIRKKYGIPEIPKDTSVTIGISSNEEMQEKYAQYPEAAFFKLKINEAEAKRIIDAHRKLSSKPFAVDANQGFSSVDRALKWADKLFEYGCYYFEQPFPKEDLDSHRRLKERSKVPIIADESFQRLPDMPGIAKIFHGVNVKLMKSGGIAEARRALIQAKENGLMTMIGCMSESTIAVEAAWSLAPLADWADLDGPLLIANDLFNPALNLTREEIIRKLKNSASE